MSVSSNLQTKPSWLDTFTDADVAFGFDATGMWFTGDAADAPYPIRTNYDIDSDETVVVIYTFVHDEVDIGDGGACPDQGICFFKADVEPYWSWGDNTSRIAVQYNCGGPEINGQENSVDSAYSLTVGDTYTARVTYNPVAETITHELFDGASVAATLVDTLVLENERLSAGAYRIGFHADLDADIESSEKSYFTYLEISEGPVEAVTRVFRAMHFPNRRREVVSELDPTPINVQPGEMLYDAEENKLYAGQEDNTAVEISSGGLDLRWNLFLPPAPASLTATPGNSQVSLAWSAPTVLAQTPVTDYVVQYSSNSGASWATFSDSTSTSTSAVVTGLTNDVAYIFRVAAVTGIGQGSWSTASSAVTPSSFIASAVLLTTGTSYIVPDGSYTMKAWAVGAGGSQGALGGNAGAVAYKTWSVTPGSTVAYSLGGNSTYYSRTNTTVTYGGVTISAQSGSGSDWSNEVSTFSGGDGGAGGGLHGYPDGSNVSGGAIGGNGAATACGRYAATDVSGLFAAVVLAGGSVTESCGATAAFGSGGSQASSLRAGIGGGGAYFGGDQTTTVGGPSAVVLYFS
jgi:hypothetical protein